MVGGAVGGRGRGSGGSKFSGPLGAETLGGEIKIQIGLGRR